MSAPTINANAANIFKNHTHDWVLFFGSLLSVKPKQSPTFYLLKQLNNSCSQIDNFSPISPSWYCVTQLGMSALGQKRTSGGYSITSSAGNQASGAVRPSALAVLRLITSSNLFRPLDRQIGRLFAFKDAIDVGRGPPK